MFSLEYKAAPTENMEQFIVVSMFIRLLSKNATHSTATKRELKDLRVG